MRKCHFSSQATVLQEFSAVSTVTAAATATTAAAADDDDFVFEVNNECTIHSYTCTSTQTNASFKISYADTFHIFLHLWFVCRFRKRVICERNTIAVIIVGYSLVLIVCIRAFKISS